MDSVYENVPRPPRRHDRRQRRSDDIHKNKDHSPAVDTTGAAPSAAQNKHPCKAVAASLGLLCLILLIGLVLLVVLYTRDNSEWEAQMALLHNRFNNLTHDNYRLQTSYDTVSRERDQLRTRYSLVSEERDQLQTRYNLVSGERDQLRTRYNLVSEERDQLRARCTELANLEEGWKYFKGSFYLVSSGNKTWQQSRDDCLQQGADLLIINSKEEQAFANQFKKYMWIGLTDLETEGTWKWVDGTLPSKSYWSSNEPNGARAENCGDIKNYNGQKSWNDESCDILLDWICEKKLFP